MNIKKMLINEVIGVRNVMRKRKNRGICFCDIDWGDASGYLIICKNGDSHCIDEDTTKFPNIRKSDVVYVRKMLCSNSGAFPRYHYCDTNKGFFKPGVDVPYTYFQDIDNKLCKN